MGDAIAGLLSSHARASCARRVVLRPDPGGPQLCAVGFLRVRVHALAELVCFVAFGGFALPQTSQAATGERAPGDDSDALGLAKWNHLALFFAIKQVVM